jgi:hypothetical protein
MRRKQHKYSNFFIKEVAIIKILKCVKIFVESTLPANCQSHKQFCSSTCIKISGLLDTSAVPVSTTNLKRWIKHIYKSELSGTQHCSTHVIFSDFLFRLDLRVRRGICLPQWRHTLHQSDVYRFLFSPPEVQYVILTYQLRVSCWRFRLWPLASGWWYSAYRVVRQRGREVRLQPFVSTRAWSQLCKIIQGKL